HRAVIAAEGQLAIGARHGAGAPGDGGVAQPNPRGADGQRPGAIGVRYAHAQPAAAKADARHHAQRVIVEADDAFRRPRPCGPSADPMAAAWHDTPPSLSAFWLDGAAQRGSTPWFFRARHPGGVPTTAQGSIAEIGRTSGR